MTDTGEVNIAIPLMGKMATRSFHTSHLRAVLSHHGIAPIYVVPDHSLSRLSLPPARYKPIHDEPYREFVKKQRLLPHLMILRRYLVPTPSTDLLIRQFFESRIFSEAPISKILLYNALLNSLRHIPRIGQLVNALEILLYSTKVHTQELLESKIRCVVTPGMGSLGFEVEGLFAREAAALRIPVLAVITNYDNLTSRGYRSFMPDCLAVWSRDMADEAMKFHHVPSSRLVITGPLQFDRYFQTLRMNREEFLLSKGLDPNKKTILFAGGRNIFHYYHFYQMLKDGKLPPCNIIFRPYPAAPEIFGSAAWQTIMDLVEKVPALYLSNPLNESVDTLSAPTILDDIHDPNAEIDELHCLLRYSDILINFFSTISLEAAVCDLPVIHIAYDTYTSGVRSLHLSGFHLKHYLHRKTLRFESARVARSPEELLKSIDAYLENRSLDRDNRREYALFECEHLDGNASERFVAALEALMQRHKI